MTFFRPTDFRPAFFRLVISSPDFRPNIFVTFTEPESGQEPSQAESQAKRRAAERSPNSRVLIAELRSPTKAFQFSRA